MSVALITTNKSPYVLDLISDGKITIPALTRKNADFIEAVVRLDSNYGNDDVVASVPDKAFDPERHFANSEGLYCGSTAYWFDRMKTVKDDFDRCLLGAIISIDRTNSTHLEATKDGRREMQRIIKTRCSDVDSLRFEIDRRYKDSPEEHLIGKMSIELPAKGKSGTRSNLSFATKFCAYASCYLKCENSYSKYDNIVSNHLSDYACLYLNDENFHKNSIKCSSLKKNKLSSSEEKLKYITSVYTAYSDCIEKIISKLETDENIRITKDELDHIIWYGFKGR